MKVIITGGAGFIGCNAASRYLRQNNQVIVIDDLSRTGVTRNLDWLKGQGDLSFYKVDLRDAGKVSEIFEEHRDTELVLHLAGQTAVTTSVNNPRADFEANALGTFNVLEAARQSRITAPLIYASTNKVYGGMEDVGIVLENDRYAYDGLPKGVSEERGLDFHSPYGCSKGAADQYVRDYHRIYGLKTIVFRQSCIYGYRQFGVEDQGWIAWFMIATLLNKPITVYGDGKQVRDILFVDDLLDAYEAARLNIEKAAGQVYNIGGGPDNVISLLELLAFIERRKGSSLASQFDDWRPGDQRVFVSDIGRAQRELGWTPKVICDAGLDTLYSWIIENRELFQ
jgi:CDP-paratose 2-epimerase